MTFLSTRRAGTEILNVVIDGEADWHHSAFPSPLIMIDYDANDRPIQVVAVGPVADLVCSRLDALLAELVRA
jgi:hypothetical protein